MSHVIAVAGKGGVGKTTLCGLLIQYLCEQKKGPILAVDADANSNLNEVLGVEVEATLGDIREEIARAETAKENPIPAGVSKADYAEFKFNSALIEDDDFDMLVMGRTQGKGCYCFVNGLLQAQLAKLQNNYPYMVVDNEAGMEHISRGILPSMETAILVSDCSRRGVQAVGRMQRARGGKIPAVSVETPKPAEKQNEKCTPARRGSAEASVQEEAKCTPPSSRRPSRRRNRMKNVRR